jgi:hypothetical protein
MRKTKTPQPAVGGLSHGRNTGSPSVSSPPGSETSFARDQAVAFAAIGLDESMAALGIRLHIDDHGRLFITHPTQWWQASEVSPGVREIEFTQAQTEAIGDFLRLTEPLWKP